MSLDCPLLKPACKRQVVNGKTPFEKPKCPLTDLVPKCPLRPPPPKCPLAPPQCPLIPQPCPLSPKFPLNPCPPPPCPLICPPPCPLKCPPCPSPCPLICPPCPLTCQPCPPPCPLTCQPCPPPCPLTCQPCPPCPLTCQPCPPPCPLTCQPCPPPCPFTCSPCPSHLPLTCPPCLPPCPLVCPPICPLTSEPYILSIPKCPLIPSPCPLSVPPKPQCPLLPPQCPLKPPPCPLKPTAAGDTCPLDNVKSSSKSSCAHTEFLNKSLSKKPLSFPLPPPVCHEVARKCPFEPKPTVCHELCPCSEVPMVEAGPICPFLPPEPVCPPLCPLERQPDCPLIQKPKCMWKPEPPTPCPLSVPPRGELQSQSNQCALNNANICPSFLQIPGKAKESSPLPKTSNITMCPFCEDEPEPCAYSPKSKTKNNPHEFHFPSCPLFQQSCQLQSLPTNEAVCPFHPYPCPLVESGDCPLKVPPLQPKSDNSCSQSNNLSPGESCECVSLNSGLSNYCPKPPECPLKKLLSKTGCPLESSERKSFNARASNCPSRQPECPLEDIQCPLADNFQCPPPPKPPCPVKGCMKKSSCRNSGDCPVKTDSCAMFPEGRCPMEDLGLCDCDYPVPPCLADNADRTEPAPSQYCLKDNCCMGLPDPPTTPAPATDDTFYSFVALNPEKESTKYYVDISDEPPEDMQPFSSLPPKQPLRPQCSILKFGEGYKECKTVKKILEKRGSCADTSSQYDPNDCPMDKMAKMIRMSNAKNKKKNKK